MWLFWLRASARGKLAIPFFEIAMPTYSTEPTVSSSLPPGVANGSLTHLNGVLSSPCTQAEACEMERELQAVTARLDSLLAAKSHWLQAALNEALYWLHGVNGEWSAAVENCQAAQRQEWAHWAAYTDPRNCAPAKGEYLLSDEQMLALKHLHAQWHASHVSKESLTHHFSRVDNAREQAQTFHDSRAEAADQQFDAQIESLYQYEMHLVALLEGKDQTAGNQLTPLMEDGEDMLPPGLELSVPFGDESAADTADATAPAVAMVGCDFTGMVYGEWNAPSASHHFQ